MLDTYNKISLYEKIITSGKIEKIEEYLKGKPKYQELQDIISWVLVKATGESFENSKREESQEVDTIPLEQLNDITDPQYAGKLIRVKAIVSSNLIPYNVPHKVNIQCTNATEKHTTHNNGGIPYAKNMTIPEKKLPDFVDLSSVNKNKMLLYFGGVVLSSECRVSATEIESITINKMKIRPIMHSLISDGEKFLDDKGNKYSSFDIYLIQKNFDIILTAGKEIEITGYIIPDPKNSKVTIMAITITELNENNYNLDKIKELQEFHKKRDTSSIINWYTSEFSKYSKIVKRENVIVGVILNMFSSLGFEFEGETIRGWVNAVLGGDSTTGKSEVVKKTIKLLRVGQIASGEMASMAGIAGAAIQTSGGQWFTDYGLLPLQDRKALWIDGAHKLGKYEIDKLAESERNGKIEINKASKGEAWARTRQGKIMNPVDQERRDTITMSNFIYPVQALTNLFQLQSIARIDLVIFVIDNVGPQYRNIPMDGLYDPILKNYSDLIKLIWSKCAIQFEEGVINEILDGATILENKFKTEDMPLIFNDQKYKLAKLAVSIAGFTGSFNEIYDEIIVKKEHVEYIIDFITTEYTEIGLADIKQQGTFGDINIQTLYQITEKINEKIDEEIYEKATNIISWIGRRRKTTKDEIMKEFELNRDKQAIPLLSYLVNEDILKRSKLGCSITKKGIALAKFIINSVDICQKLEDQYDDLIKSFQCDGCHAIWQNTRESIEEIQKHHKCLYADKITRIVD